jgi:hypothetical protein
LGSETDGTGWANLISIQEGEVKPITDQKDVPRPDPTIFPRMENRGLDLTLIEHKSLAYLGYKAGISQALNQGEDLSHQIPDFYGIEVLCGVDLVEIIHGSFMMSWGRRVFILRIIIFKS